MGKLEGKVAFITGAARGQGRSHAIRLAQEGADVIAVDICAPIDSVPYPLASPDDLDETAAQVRALGRRVHVAQADVRDRDALQSALYAGVAEVGPVDIVLANAGIAPMSLQPKDVEWTDVVDVNLTGVYHTVLVAYPDMVERGAGGSIVLTSSTAGLTGIGGNTPGGLGYTAAKHGVVGLMRAWANYLGPHGIRVNSVHPTGVDTPMVTNDALRAFLAANPAMDPEAGNVLPIAMVEPVDISHAIAWLVSDEARYVTGVTLPVDAGFVVKK